MKKILKTSAFLFLLIFSFSSCETEKEPSIYNTLDPLSFNERIKNLDELSNDVMTFYTFINNKNKENSKYSKEEAEILLVPIILKTKKIFNYLGFEEDELKKIAGKDTETIYTILGISLAAKHMSSIDKSNFDNDNINTFAKAGGVWFCLKDAIGINALSYFMDATYNLYAGEVAAGWAVDAAAATAFRRAGWKVVKGLLGKYFTGVGALVIVAQFTYCMLNSNINESN